MIEMKETFTWEIMDFLRALKEDRRISEREHAMFSSFLMEYLRLQMKIEEYKFRLNEK